MMTFGEYCQYREGLWLNDKNAVVGLSKIAPPKPPKKTRQPAPPRIKPVQAPAKPMGEVQMPDVLTMMGQMGINLVEPSRDQMKRLVDKSKNRVIVPSSFPQRAAGNAPLLPGGLPRRVPPQAASSRVRGGP